ncbi:hypothetical protein [Burkholderia thailandensis]|uniref:hypothetical protein n=1 Tax=Burkholderia thailandensis TaxID=57975 RepID=UPI00217DDFF5|nr:hypothetical protein [Burkholderia thailandensis]MCS6428106.1 hypothetical protein [Burkholderia thailandensis]MCS6467194.1 hypothetical protein [Burkholderia thailandensis]
MKTAYELLLDAPDQQVKRCQLAWKAIAVGEWQDAAHFFRNAAEEEGTTPWAAEARALAEACQGRVNPKFDLGTLRRATDKYLEFRRAEYNHNGAVHQAALYFRDELGLDLVDAMQLVRDAAQDA